MTIYNWKNYPLIPKNGLEAWHQFETGVSANNLINDYSGHSRNVACSSSGAPVLTSNVINGQPGWYFSGSSNPLAFSGSVTGLKHIFVAMSLDEATFTVNRGILSGVTVGDILVTNSSGVNFFDLGVSDYIYRKADVVYANAAQKGPVGGEFAVIELQFPSGNSTDGVQIGQQLALTARKHKGYFFEDLMYSVTLNDLGRFRILNYFAMRYRLWQRASDGGLYIFPFAANKTVSAERDIENFVSEPYDGPLKALVRGSFKTAYSSQYTLREEAEYTAAEAFHQQHRPIKDFIFRDWRYQTPVDTQCRFTSSVKNQGSDTTNRFNYTFDHVQTA